jgi:hypothetical protein
MEMGILFSDALQKIIGCCMNSSSSSSSTRIFEIDDGMSERERTSECS